MITWKFLEIDESEPMKFVEPSHYTDPDTAARKLVEIANAAEAVQDGWLIYDSVSRYGP